MARTSLVELEAWNAGKRRGPLGGEGKIGESYDNRQPTNKPKKLSSGHSRPSRNLAAKMKTRSKMRNVGR